MPSPCCEDCSTTCATGKKCGADCKCGDDCKCSTQSSDTADKCKCKEDGGQCSCSEGSCACK